ncbi:MAG TPA: thioesterase domain-containing protein, partial [Chitinophagaceae bacterium]|nr:thioesterase domain-containing protein [Chitinophagaceae bacterium]
PLYNSVEQIAAQFANEVINHHVKGEVVLWGYSMGVAVAFEMAKLLEQKGVALTLVLIDRGIPTRVEQWWRQITPQFATELLMELYKKLVPEDQINEPALKRFLLNNNRILSRYYQAGSSTSKIFVFEAQKKGQNMRKWNKYTSAGIVHNYVQGEHLEALSAGNTEHMASIICNAFHKS